MAYGNDNNNQWGGGDGRHSRRPGLSVSAQSLSAMPRSPAEALEPSRGPEPPRRSGSRRPMHPILLFINGLLTLLLVGAVALLAGIYFVKHQFTRQGPLDYATVVDVRNGMGTMQIANKLQREGVINHWSMFMLSWYFVHKTPSLKAGEYAIPKGASINEVLLQLMRGRGIFNKITIPEGLTSEQIVARINVHPRLSGEIKDVPPEGSLLPDTYTYSSNSDRQDIIKRMQSAQQKLLKEAWKKRVGGLPVKTPQEALILASIVEKETGKVDERQRVAGVFVNRLRKGMRLQSDPTIIYGLVGGKGTLGRPILRSEIRSQTPYNTYVINGLPPTPIANPGKAAIEAVLNPAKTNDLFFVADGTGGHAFAPDLKGHKDNVKRWREVEKEMREREKEEEAEKLAKAEETEKQRLVEEAKRKAAGVPGVSISEQGQEKQQQGEGVNSWPTVSQSATEKSFIPIPERRPEQ